MKFKSLARVTATLLLLALSSQTILGKVQLKLCSFAYIEPGRKFVLLIAKKDEQTNEVKYESVTDPMVIDWRCFTMPLTLKRGPYIIADATWSEGEKPNIITKFNFPKEGNKFIAILISDGKDIRVELINSDKTKMKRGDVRMYNLTGKTVYAELDDVKLILPSEKNTIFQPKKKQATGTYPAKFYTKEKGKYEFFRATSWPYSKRKRAFIFFYKLSAGEYVQMKAIDEYDTWIKTEEESKNGG